MRPVLRVLVVVGLIVAVAGAAWAECAGDDPTPEQQACCATMGHDCGAAGAEMGCCTPEPQTPERLQASGVRLDDLLVPALVTGPLAVVPQAHVGFHAVRAASLIRDTLKLPDRPAHLLLSVLLI